MFASSNIIYKRIANAYTRCRRITNPTKRLFNVPLDLCRLQSKNVFPAKIQQAGRSNLTFRSFRSINLK